jgi:HEAT repeat protein
VMHRAIEEADPRQPASSRARQLVGADSRSSGPILIAHLGDPERRRLAIDLLGASREAAAVEPLSAVLGDPDQGLRREAAVALGQIKHPAALDALMRATADDDYEVRDAAMAAVDRFGMTATLWGLASTARSVILESIESPVWNQVARHAPAAQLTAPTEEPSTAPRRRRRWGR